MTTPPPKKSDLGVRTASAVVMLTVAGTALWLGGWWWTVFVAAVALGVLWEWWGLIFNPLSNALVRIAWLVVGAIYVGLASTVLIGFRIDPHGPKLAITIVAVVIATDIGAYFAGRTIGGPKIAPEISPSKTWAGLAGGAALATLVLVAVHPIEVLSKCMEVRYLCGNGFAESASKAIHNPSFSDAWLGPVFAIIAQSGDFFESWMKRRAGVKDSGNLIPGHGGLFDRVDGLLAVCFVIGLFMLAMRVLG